MKGRKIYLPVGVMALLLFFVSTSWAVKKPVMPDNFGSDAWAVANYREAVDYLKYMTKKDVQNRLLAVPKNLRKQAWDEFWKPYDPVKSTPDFR